MSSIIHVVEATATGTLSMVALCANLQVSMGHRVSIIYSERKETPKDLYSIFNSDVALIKIDMGFKNFPLSLFKLSKEIDNLNPDVIHCHSSFAGFVGRLSSIGKEVKVFYSPHCIAFMRQDISTLQRFLFRSFELIACMRPATYLACSQSEKVAIQSILPFVRVKLLENAVDLSEFRHIVTSKAASNHKKRIVTVGGIRPQKGPEEFAKIARQCKSENSEFFWIGDGDNKDKELLLESGVIITGWMSKNEVICSLQESDLYISTSRWEGMPVSIIEAMAAKLPIIARDCSGNIDVISHQKNGYLFSETEDAVSFVNDWHQDSEELDELSKLGYKEVYDRFSIERFKRDLEDIYG
ncbi:glycosyltransferase family 4 protein [Vibrio crassostreae]|uniref:glycosyltransferase family 4 protein n=1 Tax=Vibrio crassostreae TaxID=246167 RepID=UPI000F47D9DF|nr:glycosyltransferase family 4 protein [Vibrio crassostreae]NOH77548.1 glycosyltransferase family 4 protein [Vibrio crassostreae]NOI55647.1 glycosyltransferase family 4 protein [Vibrio crassostreae]ROR09687.1 glycosyltransferase involved in cell wall biosynthesis [Vibrio crassostreae]CAK1794346.1 Glycosyltransferase family 4 protein [Vibrio crassostreae]CAK2279311.1 Glycosyltransferase family 4 protein [Vibrio crassostreae]